ncbi:MAG: hypothetical protein ACMXX9_02860 [Candidatus Woesearchaeota archaeon]
MVNDKKNIACLVTGTTKIVAGHSICCGPKAFAGTNTLLASLGIGTAYLENMSNTIGFYSGKLERSIQELILDKKYDLNIDFTDLSQRMMYSEEIKSAHDIAHTVLDAGGTALQIAGISLAVTALKNPIDKIQTYFENKYSVVRENLPLRRV